jgi:hypothetical protein
MNTAAEILTDSSLQTQLHNADAMAGLDAYLDEMAEVEEFLKQETGLDVRGAGDRLPDRPRPISYIWPQGLVVDIALGIDALPDILLRYNMTEEHWASLSDNPAFRVDLARTRKEISENGLSFKRKAATQAEMYLIDMDKIMADPEASQTLKHNIFTTMARLGELEPVKARESDVVTGGGFNIQINIGG